MGKKKNDVKEEVVSVKINEIIHVSIRFPPHLYSFAKDTPRNTVSL